MALVFLWGLHYSVNLSGRVHILTILSLLVYETWMFFFVTGASSVSFNSDLQFSLEASNTSRRPLRGHCPRDDGSALSLSRGASTLESFPGLWSSAECRGLRHPLASFPSPAPEARCLCVSAIPFCGLLLPRGFSSLHAFQPVCPL